MLGLIQLVLSGFEKGINSGRVVDASLIVFLVDWETGERERENMKTKIDGGEKSKLKIRTKSCRKSASAQRKVVTEDCFFRPRGLCWPKKGPNLPFSRQTRRVGFVDWNRWMLLSICLGLFSIREQHQEVYLQRLGESWARNHSIRSLHNTTQLHYRTVE